MIDKHQDTAFPASVGFHSHSGLSQRAYIATAALTGILANPNTTMQGMNKAHQNAVRVADALLAELDKERG